jgi:hypothetical protein
MPTEIRTLPIVAGQPLKPAALGWRIFSPVGLSQRRQAGIDQTRHKAVQAAATKLISAAVVYRTRGESTLIL